MRATYHPDDDILFLRFNDKLIAREESHGWNLNMAYAADGDVVEMTVLDAKASGLYPIHTDETPQGGLAVYPGLPAWGRSPENPETFAGEAGYLNEGDTSGGVSRCKISFYFREPRRNSWEPRYFPSIPIPQSECGSSRCTS